jgi:hypothetical protein
MHCRHQAWHYADDSLAVRDIVAARRNPRCHDGARSCTGMTLKAGRGGKELPLFSDRSRQLKNKNGGSTQLIAGQFPCLEIKNSLF